MSTYSTIEFGGDIIARLTLAKAVLATPSPDGLRIQAVIMRDAVASYAFTRSGDGGLREIVREIVPAEQAKSSPVQPPASAAPASKAHLFQARYDHALARRLRAELITQAEIAGYFGVTPKAISNVTRGVRMDGRRGAKKHRFDKIEALKRHLSGATANAIAKDLGGSQESVRAFIARVTGQAA